LNTGPGYEIADLIDNSESDLGFCSIPQGNRMGMTTVLNATSGNRSRTGYCYQQG
jgi:hypothetical protein